MSGSYFEGILTARGGMTSHAAVVARGWGKTCVSGCSELVVDEDNRWFTLGGRAMLHECPLKSSASLEHLKGDDAAYSSPPLSPTSRLRL